MLTCIVFRVFSFHFFQPSLDCTNFITFSVAVPEFVLVGSSFAMDAKIVPMVRTKSADPTNVLTSRLNVKILENASLKRVDATESETAT